MLPIRRSQYATHQLIRGLYPDMRYNNQTSAEEGRGLVLSENRLVGVPRLRQVRVRNDSCTVHDDFHDVITSCYGQYGSGEEDSTPYGPNDS